MNINSFFIFNILILSISFGLVTASLECELRDKLERGMRELDRGVRHAGKKQPKEIIQSLKERLKKKNPESPLHGIAKNIEVILSKLIPNHNLVQDLMGYVTMPRLEKKYPEITFQLVPRHYMQL